MVKPASVLQCLIVSADERRRALFERAACEGGWQTSLCVDPVGAIAHLSRSFVHLAIVDLEHQALGTFGPLLQKLASHGGLLWIVCGNEGQVDEEVWVRQSGAWLYLPGVTDASNLALLCGEARHIAERLSKTNDREHSGAKAPLASRR
jgi:DNA-binding NtrC family response regulator